MWGLLVVVALMGLVVGAFIGCGFLLFVEFYMRYMRRDFLFGDKVDSQDAEL